MGDYMEHKMINPNFNATSFAGFTIISSVTMDANAKLRNKNRIYYVDIIDATNENNLKYNNNIYDLNKNCYISGIKEIGITKDIIKIIAEMIDDKNIYFEAEIIINHDFPILNENNDSVLIINNTYVCFLKDNFMIRSYDDDIEFVYSDIISIKEYYKNQIL